MTSHYLPPVCLASGSPRRRDLLRSIGLEVLQRAVDVDETPGAQEAPRDYVLRLALEKADAGSRLGEVHGLPVIAGDTAVVLDGDIFGKPVDEDDAVGMLLRLAGRTHQVMSAVALHTAGKTRGRVVVTDVRFRDIGEAEARAYWRTGEPRDKAGAYAVQGRGALFVSHLAGSYSAVVGLPLFETAALLCDAGLQFDAGTLAG
jgi:septum formation protein